MTETVSYNLRFPGQYYLPETGLFYNYFRDYDPQTGRYIESDPIGLHAGINTYVYGYSNGITYRDPTGLWSVTIEGYIGLGGAIVITGTGFQFDSVGYRGGIGYGGGFDINPRGKRPDPCAPHDSNSFGVYGEGSIGALIGSLAVGGNYGATLKTFDDGSYKWDGYGGIEPELSTGRSSYGWIIGKWGVTEIEAEVSAGIEYTHNF